MSKTNVDLKIFLAGKHFRDISCHEKSYFCSLLDNPKWCGLKQLQRNMELKISIRYRRLECLNQNKYWNWFQKNVLGQILRWLYTLPSIWNKNWSKCLDLERNGTRTLVLSIEIDIPVGLWSVITCPCKPTVQSLFFFKTGLFCWQQTVHPFWPASCACFVSYLL